MKFTVSFLILISSISGCNNSKPKKVLSEKEKQVQWVKEELSDFSEKIVLLSTIKRISYDSLYQIFTDYHIIVDYASSDSLKFCSEKAINYISGKYHISKRRVASLVFSFKYEMLSKEEIVDDELEKLEEEQQDPPEDPY
jgi:hypothetical protein